MFLIKWCHVYTEMGKVHDFMTWTRYPIFLSGEYFAFSGYPMKNELYKSTQRAFLGQKQQKPKIAQNRPTQKIRDGEDLKVVLWCGRYLLWGVKTELGLLFSDLTIPTSFPFWKRLSGDDIKLLTLASVLGSTQHSIVPKQHMWRYVRGQRAVTFRLTYISLLFFFSFFLLILCLIFCDTTTTVKRETAL